MSAETEVAVYAKITDWNGLKLANHKEHHVQLEGSFVAGPRMRVRIINDNEYILTMKVRQENAGEVISNNEHNVSVDKGFAEDFKKCASKMVVKDRYVFNSSNVTLKLNVDNEVKAIQIPNIKYEVDVYEKATGDQSEWCKIDVEIDSILKFLNTEYPEIKEFKLNIKVSHLPFKPVEPILAQNATDEQKAFLSSLWDNEFNRLIE